MGIRTRAAGVFGRMRLAMPVLVIAVTAGGCGAGQAASGPAAHVATAQAAPSSPRPSSSTPPAPVAQPSGHVGKLCGFPDAPGRLTKIRATDGVRLAAIQIGTGPRGVVLIPELGMAGECGWWQYAANLAAHGFNVVAFDHRCKGDSDCPSGPAGSLGSAASAPAGLMADINGAVRSLRAAGAVQVALVGGSQGGAEALIAAARPQPGVTGVAALSADELPLPLATSPYPATAQAAAPRVRLPALMAVSSADPGISVQDTQRLYASVGSRSKRLVVLGPQAGHGWDLVDADGPGRPVPAFAGTLTAFLRAVTAAPAGSPSPAGAPTAAGSATSVDGCFSTARGLVETLPGPGGETLTMATMGTGPRVVILSEQSNQFLCSWLPFAGRLTAAGYRVVLWDFGAGPPADELTAVARRVASARGARIVLAGASEGAKASLITAARLGPMIGGVVSLSAEAILSPGIQVADSVRRVRCPLLLVTADQDPYDSAPAARQFMALAPSAAKRLVTVPGTDHGTALLSGRSGTTTIPAVTGFLRRVLG
jgi:pimeloyl-ACP methyl ester carboxylesterase